MGASRRNKKECINFSLTLTSQHIIDQVIIPRIPQKNKDKCCRMHSTKAKLATSPHFLQSAPSLRPLKPNQQNTNYFRYCMIWSNVPTMTLNPSYLEHIIHKDMGMHFCIVSNCRVHHVMHLQNCKWDSVHIPPTIVFLGITRKSALQHVQRPHWAATSIMVTTHYFSIFHFIS